MAEAYPGIVIESLDPLDAIESTQFQERFIKTLRNLEY